MAQGRRPIETSALQDPILIAMRPLTALVVKIALQHGSIVRKAAVPDGLPRRSLYFVVDSRPPALEFLGGASIWRATRGACQIAESLVPFNLF